MSIPRINSVFDDIIDDYKNDFDEFQGILENIETNIQQKEEYLQKKVEHHCKPYQELLSVYEMQRFDEGMYMGSNVIEGKLNNCVHHHSNALISDLNELKDRLEYFRNEENKISTECSSLRKTDAEKCIETKCTRLKEELDNFIGENSLSSPRGYL